MVRYALPPVSFSIESIKTIDFRIDKLKTIVVDLENIVIGADTHAHYDGEYVITPRVHQQQFATDNKVMDDDITVLSIPISKVSNPQGGKTATIG